MAGKTKTPLPEYLLNVVREDARDAARADERPGIWKRTTQNPYRHRSMAYSHRDSLVPDDEDQMAKAWIRAYADEEDKLKRDRLAVGMNVVASPKLGMPYEKWAGDRGIVENTHAGYSGDMVRVRWSDGSSWLHSYGEVHPERRKEITELHSNKEELIAAAKATMEEMKKIVKALEA